MNCPSCGRPVAVARASCLYCGAPLSAAALAAAKAASAALARSGVLGPAAPEAAAGERTLLILDFEGADAGALAGALGISAYDAGQRVRRGGLQLLKILERGEALAEARRLRERGLRLHSVAEQETRLPPLRVTGGLIDGQKLDLRLEQGRLRLAAADLRLVVRGPIAREYQTRAPKKGLALATLEPGYRFHLHRSSEPAPVEIDPWSFTFGAAGGASQSSLLTLAAWIETATRGVPLDDGFRHLPPALAPELAGESGELKAATLGQKPREQKEASLVLDNLKQFRFYSAWRAAVERERRG